MIKTDENELNSPIVTRIRAGYGGHIDEIDVDLIIVSLRDVNRARIFGEIHLGIYLKGDL